MRSARFKSYLGSEASQPLTRISGKWFFYYAPVLGQVLDKNGMFLIENMSWNCSTSYESVI